MCNVVIMLKLMLCFIFLMEINKINVVPYNKCENE